MELWDIYDSNKQKTGRTMKRNDWCLKDGEYHLTVLGVIARPDGKFLITQRVMTKSWAPGWWEVSGGAAMAGEESEDAVKREILEEVGLDVTGSEGGYLFTYHRENPGEGDNYFVDVYRFIMDFDESDVKIQEKKPQALSWQLWMKLRSWQHRESSCIMIVLSRHFPLTHKQQTNNYKII